MTTEERRILEKIKRASLAVLKKRVHDSNYGILAPPFPVNPMDVHFLYEHKVRVGDDFIYLKGVPIFRIKRHYESRKRNGMYKELTPTLESLPILSSHLMSAERFSAETS